MSLQLICVWLFIGVNTNENLFDEEKYDTGKENQSNIRNWTHDNIEIDLLNEYMYQMRLSSYSFKIGYAFYYLDFYKTKDKAYYMNDHKDIRVVRFEYNNNNTMLTQKNYGEIYNMKIFSEIIYRLTVKDEIKKQKAICNIFHSKTNLPTKLESLGFAIGFVNKILDEYQQHNMGKLYLFDIIAKQILKTVSIGYAFYYLDFYKTKDKAYSMNNHKDLRVVQFEYNNSTRYHYYIYFSLIRGFIYYLMFKVDPIFSYSRIYNDEINDEGVENVGVGIGIAGLKGTAAVRESNYSNWKMLCTLQLLSYA